MNINFDTTVEQDLALAELNSKSNPENPPPIEEFALSVAQDHFQSLVKINQATTLESKVVALKDRVDKLTPGDFDALDIIIAKHAGSDVPAEPVVPVLP